MISKSQLEYSQLADLIGAINTKTFYQYANYDIALEKIILNQSLQFSDPSTFNDPFDCNEKLLKIKYYDKDIKEAINNTKHELTRQKRREVIKEFKNPKKRAQILKSKRKEYKLSCFSKYNDQTLMWSHYADKHNGICIGFNFPHRYDDKFILCPVKYIKELKELDCNADTHRVILYWLTNKSINWEYEGEFRAISHSKNIDSKYEYTTYDSKYIQEIIFGCNLSDEKIYNAISRIKKSNIDLDNIIIKKMVIDENTFSLKEIIIRNRRPTKNSL